jgi:hypothetical protein
VKFALRLINNAPRREEVGRKASLALRTLKMEAVDFSEMLVNLFRTTRHHVLESSTAYCHSFHNLRTNKESAILVTGRRGP